MSSSLNVIVSRGVAQVQLARASKSNAISLELLEALPQTARELRCRVSLLNGCVALRCDSTNLTHLRVQRAQRCECGGTGRHRRTLLWRVSVAPRTWVGLLTHSICRHAASTWQRLPRPRRATTCSTERPVHKATAHKRCAQGCCAACCCTDFADTLLSSLLSAGVACLCLYLRPVSLF